jgi:hypothetical protein
MDVLLRRWNISVQVGVKQPVDGEIDRPNHQATGDRECQNEQRQIAPGKIV